MSKYLNDAYTLRIPAELKARVAESAKAHNRSMNADIVARLEKSFEEENSNQKMFTEQETIRAMERLMSGIVSNAIKTLLQHGVDKEIIHQVFIHKPEEPT